MRFIFALEDVLRVVHLTRPRVPSLVIVCLVLFHGAVAALGPGLHVVLRCTHCGCAVGQRVRVDGGVASPAILPHTSSGDECLVSLFFAQGQLPGVALSPPGREAVAVRVETAPRSLFRPCDARPASPRAPPAPSRV